MFARVKLKDVGEKIQGFLQPSNKELELRSKNVPILQQVRNSVWVNNVLATNSDERRSEVLKKLTSKVLFLKKT
jgi:hypothetical protein